MCGVARINICFTVSRPRLEEAPVMTTTELSISWLIAGGSGVLQICRVVEIFVS
jgi:hypothetical protein